MLLNLKKEIQINQFRKIPILEQLVNKKLKHNKIMAKKEVRFSIISSKDPVTGKDTIQFVPQVDDFRTVCKYFS